MTIVGNTGPGCTGLEPDLAPFHGGSTMFLYHAVSYLGPEAPGSVHEKAAA